MDSSDEPSASVGDFGFNGLAHSEETSVSVFSSIDPQEEAINNDTGESTKSRGHHIHKSASGDVSSSSGGGFSEGRNRTKLAPVSDKSNRLLTAFDAFLEEWVNVISPTFDLNAEEKMEEEYEEEVHQGGGVRVTTETSKSS